MKRLPRVSRLVMPAVPLSVLIFSTNARQRFPLIRRTVAAPKGADRMRTTLRIDGNRNPQAALFFHKQHQESLGGSGSGRFWRRL